jgi:hypothetical protein
VFGRETEAGPVGHSVGLRGCDTPGVTIAAIVL